MQRTYRLLASAAIAVMGIPPAFAVDGGAYVEAGAEYDSNLNVDELETSSGESDQALLLGAGFDISGQPVDNLTLTGTYDITSRSYQDEDAFDQDIHLASVDVSYDVGAVTVGANHYYSYATLASDPLLQLNRSSVYLGILAQDDTYLMLSALSSRKDYEDDEARDAEVTGLGLDGFFFFNQQQTVLVLGIEGNEEDAKSDAYDYQMLAGRVRLKNRFDVSGHDNTIQLGWRYEYRDYDEPVSTVERPQFPFFGGGGVSSATRSDRISTADLSWSVGLTDVLTTEAKVEWTNYDSKLDSADYDKTVASLILRASF